MPPLARTSAKLSDLDQIVAETAARVADATIAALRGMFSESYIRGVIEREAKIAVQAAFLAEAERTRISTAAPSPRPEPSKAVQQPASRPTAYRINEATKQLGVGRTKLYELIASGALPARKRDGVTYIRAVDLEAYADGQPIIGGARSGFRQRPLPLRRQPLSIGRSGPSSEGVPSYPSSHDALSADPAG